MDEATDLPHHHRRSLARRPRGQRLHRRSLETEGFIHCSTQRQVAATATRYFPGATDLVVLCVDVSLLRHDVRYEDTSGHGQLFPHIYGPLELVAVRSVVELTPGADGSFVFDFDPEGATTEPPRRP